MKLFVIYIGGSTHTSMIELHDMRIVAAETLEDTYPALRESWWGKPESLHLDCWGELASADGHNIRLRGTPPPEGQEQLWFVNLGGYDPAEFTELHKNVFVVAPTESKAKVRALKQILHWKSHHKDKMFEIEHIASVDAILRENNLYLHLEKTETPVPFTFSFGYNPIGKTAA